MVGLERRILLILVDKQNKQKICEMDISVWYAWCGVIDDMSLTQYLERLALQFVVR